MSKFPELSEILSCSRPMPPVICGIYFLIDSDEVVYVGQSTDVMKRIYTHASGTKKFNRFSIIECESAMLNDTEAEYIVRLSPKYNKGFPVGNSRWNVARGMYRRLYYELCEYYNRNHVNIYHMRSFLKERGITQIGEYYSIIECEAVMIFNSREWPEDCGFPRSEREGGEICLLRP